MIIYQNENLFNEKKKKEIGPTTFKKLFNGRHAARTMYDASGNEEAPPGFADQSGVLEAHSTYYMFHYGSTGGEASSSRGDYGSVIRDEDGKGFRIPFLRPVAGKLGYHYRIKEAEA